MRSKLSAIIFLLGVLFVMLIALVPGMVPSWMVVAASVEYWA